MKFIGNRSALVLLTTVCVSVTVSPLWGEGIQPKIPVGAKIVLETRPYCERAILPTPSDAYSFALFDINRGKVVRKAERAKRIPTEIQTVNPVTGKSEWKTVWGVERRSGREPVFETIDKQQVEYLVKWVKLHAWPPADTTNMGAYATRYCLEIQGRHQEESLRIPLWIKSNPEDTQGAVLASDLKELLQILKQPVDKDL